MSSRPGLKQIHYATDYSGRARRSGRRLVGTAGVANNNYVEKSLMRKLTRLASHCDLSRSAQANSFRRRRSNKEASCPDTSLPIRMQNWSHIFQVFEAGGGVVHVERECRFVFNVKEFCLIHLDILINGRMVAASVSDLLDLEDSLVHSNPGAIEDPEAFGLPTACRLSSHPNCALRLTVRLRAPIGSTRSSSTDIVSRCGSRAAMSP
jgi:hypothetical protein